MLSTKGRRTAVAVLSVLLILEFGFAPVNLIDGHNAPLFREYTGIHSHTGLVVVAWIDGIGAALVALGLFSRRVGIAGAGLLSALCAWYLVMILGHGANAGGLAGFVLFGAWAVGLLWLQLSGVRTARGVVPGAAGVARKAEAPAKSR
jgi:hypothetical protein